MVKRVSAETVNMIMKTGAVKASTEVVEKARSSDAVAQAACTVLEGQRNRSSMRSVNSEELAGQGQVQQLPGIPCRNTRPSTSISHTRG